MFDSSRSEKLIWNKEYWKSKGLEKRIDGRKYIENSGLTVENLLKSGRTGMEAEKSKIQKNPLFLSHITLLIKKPSYQGAYHTNYDELAISFR